MDLKTIRGRIKDGQITTVEEFERDLLLMLSYVRSRCGLLWLINRNAMMYNGPGSQIHQMAKEMSEESESVLAQFKSLQHYR
jgi:bromodomain-containing protein 8